MKQYQAILFDLDGTLLPMDLDEFTTTYFGLLAKRLRQYDSKKLIAAVWQGTKAMITNDGTMTNEARFWNVFADLMGQDIRREEPMLEEFYRTDFHQVKSICGENSLAKQMVDLAHDRAEQVILATNPLFPRCGVESRLSWIDLTPEDFDFITTYENSAYCKPSAAYYQSILAAQQLDPTQCLMIGNDLREDGFGAGQLGIRTHIVTDCLIDHGLNLDDYAHSTFAQLLQIL